MGLSQMENLRQQLREKFPQAHALRAEAVPTLPRGRPFETHSFPAGSISEVVAASPVAGLSLLVAGILSEPEEACRHPQLVLVDGSDGFDPASFTARACSKILWVRCQAAIEMMKAADLLVHDGNVPFVLLDSTGILRRDLAALPASAWWRLKQTVERHSSRLVVLAAAPFVPCAGLRLTLSADLSLRDFDVPRKEPLERLQPVPAEGLRRFT